MTERRTYHERRGRRVVSIGVEKSLRVGGYEQTDDEDSEHVEQDDLHKANDEGQPGELQRR